MESDSAQFVFLAHYLAAVFNTTCQLVFRILPAELNRYFTAGLQELFVSYLNVGYVVAIGYFEIPGRILNAVNNGLGCVADVCHADVAFDFF